MSLWDLGCRGPTLTLLAGCGKKAEEAKAPDAAAAPAAAAPAQVAAPSPAPGLWTMSGKDGAQTFKISTSPPARRWRPAARSPSAAR